MYARCPLAPALTRRFELRKTPPSWPESLGAARRGCDLTGDRVGAQQPTEEQAVRLGLVDLVVLPATTLLNAKAPPLLVLEQTPRGGQFDHLFRDGLGQGHMPVLVGAVGVLVRVLDLVWIMRHLSHANSVVTAGSPMRSADRKYLCQTAAA
eukprot:CAMPEP_0204126622 /NCGR_PEP_ID=MMETSP0361-20130328/11112_1 /ASSEMBLY_ACC=CAM_ASM_000343 /TAXON_ID=268821 /ORGANISM="Scrippsiella Hangoei, Strain SHTV-5" /LENGTH=151 /DNA_ID=CAMNT_0051078523 /DNA_START=103 /DNA_END=555 /DNA_ORIENTATION=-